MSFSTPDSYLEGQTVQPLSVDSGATALAVFVGYTETALDTHGNNITDVLTPVGSLLDYEAYFGGAELAGMDVAIDVDGSVLEISGTEVRHYLYKSIDLYFRNGGGSCFVLSVGDYSAPVSLADFERGLSVLKYEDKPTLLILTDAVSLSDADYYTLCRSALEQCNELKDRFTILDVKDGNVAKFRDNIGAANLSYGAAYHPYLNTAFSNPYNEFQVSIRRGYGVFEKENCIRVSYAGRSAEGASISVVEAAGVQEDTPRVRVLDNTVSFVVDPGTGSAPAAIIDAWQGVSNPGKFKISVAGTGQVPLTAGQAGFVYGEEVGKLGEDRIRIDHPSVYADVVKKLEHEKLVLPPGSAVAAAYSKTDIASGPWKAPANVVINDVTGPARNIDHSGQESLNNSPDGKSINAIRSFANRGTLVWGARTLDGNSNEWRYVPVRRLFIKVESDIRRATSFAVFEPNNAITWLKIKTMLMAYLDELWSAGALNGATAEEAYFVRLGLGETMDEQDINEGRLHISVGIAAVRPAEFVAMTITHILQAS